MIAELTVPPPRWLPARLVLAAVVVAFTMAILAGKSGAEAWTATLGATELFSLCVASGVVLITALALALSTGCWLQGLLGGGARVPLELCGAVLALFPVAALTWALVHEWLVRRGLPVETLMPLELARADQDAAMETGRLLWRHLAPALVLAIPLLGAVLMTTRLPLRTRALMLCLQAPAWLILIEDVLHFMGWGGWMAQAIRSGDVNATAAGVAAGGVLMAVPAFLSSLIPVTQTEHAPRFRGWIWLPWPLWVIAAAGVGVSQTVSWGLMWLALFAMSWPAWVTALRGMKPAKQAACVAAWSLEVVSMLVVWLAAVAALHPQPLAGGVMRFFRPLLVTTNAQAAETLRDPQALLRTGVSVLGVALVLHLMSRALRWWSSLDAETPRIAAEEAETEEVAA